MDHSTIGSRAAIACEEFDVTTRKRLEIKIEISFGSSLLIFPLVDCPVSICGHEENRFKSDS